jgi:hypothetical protein
MAQERTVGLHPDPQDFEAAEHKAGWRLYEDADEKARSGRFEHAKAIKLMRLAVEEESGT